jgi:hypothetical protein
MSNHSTLSAIDTLRNTLLDIEMILEFRRGDPALHELERHVLQAVAELEAKKNVEIASLSAGDLLPIP